MSEIMPWLPHHVNGEGMTDVFRVPGISKSRKVGFVTMGLVTAATSLLSWDVRQSKTDTPDTPPSIALAKGSIPIRGSRAMLAVNSGYGIQNGEQTAEKIASIANEERISTVWINNGNNINVPAVGEAIVKVAKENGINVIAGWGESVGSNEIVSVGNYIVSKYGDEFEIPAYALDAGPGGKNTLKWVNRTVAEKIAEYCQYIEVGDYTMTAVTLLTDPNEMRRSQPLKYWAPVFNATRSASMRLRTAQSCLAGIGFPKLNEDTRTHNYYLRAADETKDPIVDVVLSEEIIKNQTGKGLFHPVHMTGDGITHAAPWDNWYAYGPYYKEVIKNIGSIVKARADKKWYFDPDPKLPQPR